MTEQVKDRLSDKPISGADLPTTQTLLDRETLPVLRKLRQRFNELVDEVSALETRITELETQVDRGDIEVVTIPDATLTLATAHAGKYLRFTNSAGCVVTVPGSVFNGGDWVHCFTAATGILTFTGSGADLEFPATCVAESAEQNSLVTVFFGSATIADLFGDLGLA